MPSRPDEAPRAEPLLALARSRGPSDREELLLRLVDLYAGSAACVGQQDLALCDVLMRLTAMAGPGARVELARRLAGEAWAPPELILALAHDRIEIARPVIAQSPRLGDEDLMGLLIGAGPDHGIEVARRGELDETVADAVITLGDRDMLAALAANSAAKLSSGAMARLVDLSESLVALRAPLSRHPGLTPELAERLHGWVGETLRAVLAERFDTVGSTHDPTGAEASQADPSIRSARDPDHSDQAAALADARSAMESRLVEKLQASGQLRPGLLIRALHEGKLVLFKTALGALGGLAPAEVEAILDAPDPSPLAQACRAVGIDRSAFATVLSLVRALNGGRPG